MFRNRLDDIIDMRHELAPVAGLIDWKRFEEAFGSLYAEKGRPAEDRFPGAESSMGKLSRNGVTLQSTLSWTPSGRARLAR